MALVRSEVKDLREKLQPLLSKLEKEIGFKMHLGNATFAGDIVTFKLECARIGVGGEVITKEVQDFKERCHLHGLKPTDLGRTFATWNGETYTIAGLLAKSRKSPILATQTKNGKQYKFQAQAVLRGLAESPASLTAPPKRTPAAIISDIRRVECQLSPECLSCDGELPAWKIKTQQSKLNAERRKLVEELGREPTGDEIYGKS